ncbi:E3 ubiquitin-protein ligase KEG [Apostasia shenzhenica]|uniref:E3 ubiquitin-protein ligase KEG n=1 Tax=Apostasia shenzhenica TaxID=1088818 RepID=A0A2I0AN64_9ASPA|nr:E3 ubiquitin-protein ligase KEG [Apostasia shenzhenica]
MDRLISLEPSNKVAIRVEPNRQCYGVLTLRNVMYTMPVAFRLVRLNRERFSIRPQTGIIAPLASLSVEITYLPPEPPEPFLPESLPDSGDTFYLDSVVAPGASVKEGTKFSALDAVPADWFTTKKKQVFTDASIRTFFVGSIVLSRLVAGGDMDKVREVLQVSDPGWQAADSADPYGQTLLHLAIAGRRSDLVQLILEFGADVDAGSSAGSTPSPLEAAAAAGEASIVELLLARGASTERSSGSAFGPLHHASMGGHAGVIKMLLLKGAAAESPAADGRTALHLAAEGRRRDCAEELLTAGARADVRGGAGLDTPLHAAAAAGDETMARLLLENGYAGLREVRNGAGKTAYDVAVEEGNGKLFDLLKMGESLSAAARKGEGRAAERAIEMGSAVDGRDGRGWTALMRAGFKGRVELIRVLLEKGAALEARDDEGYTALHCATEAGQMEAVELLMKRGADLEARTAKGRTAAEIATALGFLGILRILTPRMAPPPATAIAGKTEEIPAKERWRKGKNKGRLVAGEISGHRGELGNRMAAMTVAS